MVREHDDANGDVAHVDVGLAELVGRALMSDASHPSWDDARFLDWLADEARDRARRGGRHSPGTPRTRGEAMMARAHARRLRVGEGGSAPVVEARGRAMAGSRVAPVIELGIAAGVGRELWDEPAEARVEVPNDAPAGEYVALRIVGDSMAPLMHTGDTVLVRRGVDVRRDTVIVARHPDDGYVCKRVSRLRRETIELASLAPGWPGIAIPRDPRLIVGTVMLVWCSHRG